MKKNVKNFFPEYFFQFYYHFLWFINNVGYLYTENKDLLLSTILFLKRSLAFQEALNNYWKLHEKDYDGRISSYSLQEVI